jgi:hypothetical protein
MVRRRLSPMSTARDPNTEIAIVEEIFSFAMLYSVGLE